MESDPASKASLLCALPRLGHDRQVSTPPESTPEGTRTSAAPPGPTPAAASTAAEKRERTGAGKGRAVGLGLAAGLMTALSAIAALGSGLFGTGGAGPPARDGSVPRGATAASGEDDGREDDGGDADPGARTGRNRLLVIGLDGATLRILGPLMATGDAPAFAALAGRGSHGTLRPFEPILSPLLWNTMVTGVLPGRHGIDQFLVRVPGRPMSRAMPVTYRRVPALWNVASQAGRQVAVVGWWTTWPSEAVNGVMVSQNWTWGHDRVAATHPEDLVVRLEQLVGERLSPMTDLEMLIPDGPRVDCPARFPDASVFETQSSPEARHDQMVCDLLRTDLITLEAILDVMQTERPEIAFVYLRGIDPMSHHFWKYGFPGDANYTAPPSPAEIARYGAVLSDYYRLTDRWVGRLVAGMADANVVVLSDHGFHAEAECGGSSFEHNLLLADLGLLRQGSRGIDFAATRVLHDVVGTRSNEGTYFVNLRRRAPEGIVADGDYPALVEDTKTLLRGLRTREDRPLFAEITFDESPPAEREGPDIRVMPDLSLDPDDELTLPDGRRVPVGRYLVDLDNSGNHNRPPADVPGILFAAGPDVPHHAEVIDAALVDVGPTLACLANLALAVRPDGAIIDAVVGDRAKERCARHPIPTVDEVPNPVAVDGLPAMDQGDNSIVEQLRALGYVQ